MEYEKTEVDASLLYKTAADRDKLVYAEKEIH